MPRSCRFDCPHREPIRRRTMSHVTLLLSLLTLAGCGKNSTGPKTSGARNSTAPNANGRVISAQLYGDPAQRSSFYQLESADGVTEWFIGELDDQYTAGRLDVAGHMLSHDAISYLPRDLVALSPASPLPGASIAVGAKDLDNDGLSDVGYATLLGAVGGITNQWVIMSDSSDVWFNSIAPLSDTMFVAVGGERLSGVIRPLVALIALRAPGLLAKIAQVVLPGITGRSAAEVATDPADAGSAHRRIYVSTSPPVSTDVATLYALTIDPATLAPWSIDWNLSLTGKGAGTYVNDLQLQNDKLYAAGYAYDPDKGTSLGSWASGLVARVSLNGSLDWSQVVKVTNDDDRFFTVEPAADAITAIGRGAAYLHNSTDRFGYGWIVRLTPALGGTITNHTIGDASYAAGFNGGTYAGSTLHVIGYSQAEVENGPFRAAWTAVDETSPDATLAADADAVPVRADRSPPSRRERSTALSND